MKTKLILTLAILIVAAVSGRAAPIGTEFSYQGRLTDSTGPPSGSYDFTFTLHLAASGGVPIVTVTNLNLPVSNGGFTATVDFGGGIYNGNAYWISLGVRSNGAGGGFIALTPRQPLTPTPNASYASLAGTVPGGSITSSKLAIDSVTVFALQNNAVTAAKVASGQLVKSVNSLRDDVVLSAGPNVTITPSGNTLTLGGSSDWKLGGNAGTTAATDFVGTTDNQALVVKVNNTVGFRVEPATSGGSILPNVIGGAFNSIAAGQAGSTIAGGRENVVSSTHAAIGGGWRNQIHAGSEDSAIAGGQGNIIQANANFSTIGAGAIHNIGAGASRSTIGGGYFNRIGDSSINTTISGGRENVIQLNATSSTIGGGFLNTVQSNAIDSTISGGNLNTIQTAASSATIGGGNLNTIQTSGSFATIGGGDDNNASGPYATIGGGSGNRATTNRSTVAGGYYNQASGQYATVSGGVFNYASGDRAVAGGSYNNALAFAATVGGGNYSTANGYGSTVGGGENNNATGGNTFGAGHATVAGGYANSATGSFATVPGGALNTAGGQYSFATGRRAQALHDGAFVWADSTDADFASTATNQLLIRASGGVGLGTPSPRASLHVYSANNPTVVRVQSTGTPGFGRLEFVSNPQGDANEWRPGYIQSTDNGGFVGGLAFYVNGAGAGNKFGSNEVMRIVNGRVGIGTPIPVSALHVVGTVTATAFNPPSDRNLKENFAPVSAREVLEKVAALPISRWNFIGDAATPHVGPMAQDFHAAFHLGTDERHIATVDADGVALAAIQGLNQKVEEKAARIAELERRLERLERLLNQKNGGAK